MIGWLDCSARRQRRHAARRAGRRRRAARGAAGGGRRGRRRAGARCAPSRCSAAGSAPCGCTSTSPETAATAHLGRRAGAAGGAPTWRPPVRATALAVFARLAAAEGAVHRVPPEQVHFHEVGALDAVADVVGAAAGFARAGADALHASPVAVGSGTHARRARPAARPRPGRARAAGRRAGARPGRCRTRARRRPVRRCSPTLVTAWGPLPPLVLEPGRHRRRGPRPGRGGERAAPGPRASRPPATAADALLLEANVDDLDPRVWPGVLDALLARGRARRLADARAHEEGPAGARALGALPGRRGRRAVRRVVLTHTSTHRAARAAASPGPCSTAPRTTSTCAATRCGSSAPCSTARSSTAARSGRTSPRPRRPSAVPAKLVLARAVAAGHARQRPAPEGDGPVAGAGPSDGVLVVRDRAVAVALGVRRRRCRSAPCGPAR